tara:strand:+ start:62 stop:403 length:342 start_codon:yes stop_codon:yes gene_type:complete
MNPLILSLICLILVIISANFLSIVKNNKTLLIISLLPCIYLIIYGIYLILGPINLYEDGKTNFFLANPEEKDLPIVFIILKFYEYILTLIGAIFGYFFLKFIINLLNNKSDSV